jgi:hypothetical protein
MKQAPTGRAYLSRRSFLKLIGAGLMGLAAASLEPILGGDVAFAQRGARPMCRPGQNGQILLSEDGGNRWQIGANFGPEYHVRRVAPQKGVFKADLIYQGKKFTLVSQDGRLWRTGDFQAPSLADGKS